ncbi:uncharacterized protein LY79DRAFT_244212 [Colletotrichum navitas]|uniref:Uncharacterized protein n=1 Tax=Colletotrichum navitas TaxID=681940 RepID=A0AAD8PXR5_9PEZI|nr:uncharacterized protein LY79DRAFT_244212 [Colletotrichum navitas]KAK1586004.1 hypothetical protein LY79DRAFT_244212 [Colletotrichum navitas]
MNPVQLSPAQFPMAIVSSTQAFLGTSWSSTVPCSLTVFPDTPQPYLCSLSALDENVQVTFGMSAELGFHYESKLIHDTPSFQLRIAPHRFFHCILPVPSLQACLSTTHTHTHTRAYTPRLSSACVYRTDRVSYRGRGCRRQRREVQPSHSVPNQMSPATNTGLSPHSNLINFRQIQKPTPPPCSRDQLLTPVVCVSCVCLRPRA